MMIRKQIESSDQIILNQKDEVQKLGRIIHQLITKKGNGSEKN